MSSRIISVLALTAATAYGATIGQVFNLGIPGLEYPTKFLGYTANESELAGREGQLAPIGERQNYLVGTEYRERYINDQALFDNEYNIQASDLQAPFKASNIMSVQAQMMGLYPGSALNTLDSFQKANAVPPIEYDYSQWQNQLYQYALPYGFNTFAIFQVGRKEDFRLAVCDQNCAYFESKYAVRVLDVEAMWHKLGMYGAPTILANNTVEEVCEYYQWAYTTYRDFSYDSEFAFMRVNICPGFQADIQNAMNQVNLSESYIVTGSYMSHLASLINTTYVVPGEDTKSFKNYQTLDSAHLFTYANAISLGLSPSMSIPPASQLNFETYSDNTIKGWLNETELQLIGCTTGQSCLAQDFVNAISAIVTTSNWATACSQLVLE